MAEDLGKGYKYKKKTITYSNGDVYQGMVAAYYDGAFEPHGEGTYFNKETGVTFKADWIYRNGPDFQSIEIIDKPEGKSFVLIQVSASEIYSDLSYLGIIEAKEGTYSFKHLDCIIIEKHAWEKHLFTIKKVDDNELVFDFTGPKVSDKFTNRVAIKNEALQDKSVVGSHIIWDHDDEYDVSQSSEIKVLYF